jgi:hypothetical protein
MMSADFRPNLIHGGIGWTAVDAAPDGRAQTRELLICGKFVPCLSG